MELYVARPIDQAHYPAGEKPGWVELAESIPAVIRGRAPGLVAFFPDRAFAVSAGSEPSTGIEAINRAALACCDALLAIIPAGVGTVGTPREIEAALQAGKQVAVLTDIVGSFSLADIRSWSLDIPGLSSALDWLVRVTPARPEEAEVPLPFLIERNLPSRTYPGDAGLDLYVSQDVMVEPFGFTDVPVGARVALPPGVWARITGRSSTLRKRGMMVAEGIIDTGYRGELYSGVWNLTGRHVMLRSGERIAQLILHENVTSKFTPMEVSRERFDAIDGDDRGEAGFGSTGS